MSRVQAGRWTHEGREEVVVFLIGMRVNRLWRVDQWVPVARAMGPMLAELSRDPSKGLLGFRVLLGAGGPTVVQYWRSAADLESYANDAQAAHRPAWLAFYRRARAGAGSVGIWHETYVVPPGGAESIYGDMPPTGLARALGSVPVARRGEAFRERLDPAS